MADETKMDTTGIDPKKLKAMDDLVYARILSGAPDPADIAKVMAVTSCLGASLAQMLADPTPEQAANVKKHLLGHLMHDTRNMLEDILAPKVQQIPIDPNLN